MPFDARQLATDLLDAAYNSAGSLEAKMYIVDWPEGMVEQTLDWVVGGLPDYKLRLRGIRTDRGGLLKLGINPNTPDVSWRYRDVPVVMAEIPFDTMQLVFEPQRQ